MTKLVLSPFDMRAKIPAIGQGGAMNTSGRSAARPAFSLTTALMAASSTVVVAVAAVSALPTPAFAVTTGNGPPPPPPVTVPSAGGTGGAGGSGGAGGAGSNVLGGAGANTSNTGGAGGGGPGGGAGGISTIGGGNGGAGGATYYDNGTLNGVNVHPGAAGGGATLANGGGGGGGAGGYIYILTSGGVSPLVGGALTAGNGGAGGNGGSGPFAGSGGGGGDGGAGAMVGNHSTLDMSGNVSLTGGTGGAGGPAGGSGNGGAGGNGGFGVIIQDLGTVRIQSGSSVTGGAPGTGGTVSGSGTRGAQGGYGVGAVMSGTSTLILGGTLQGAGTGNALNVTSGTASVQFLGNPGVAGGGNPVLGGNVSVASGATLKIDQGTDFGLGNGVPATDVKLTNQISGAGAVTIAAGTRTVTLSGAEAYSGATTVQTGALNLASGTTLATSGITLNPGTSLGLQGVALTAPIAVSGDPTLLVSGSNSVATISGSGTVNVFGTSGSASTDVLTLTAANSYTAVTNVGDGTAGAAATLKAGTAGAFSANSATTVTAHSVLDLGGFNQTVSSLAGAGTVTNSGANGALLTNQGASSSFSGSLKDGANGGTLGLTENAAGNTLTLSGNNNYTGATIVQAGTLQGGATNAFSLYSATTVNSGATIDLGGYNQAVGSLSGGGTVTNSGTTSARLINTGPSSTFSGVISDGSNGGTTGLQQGSSAGGTLTLSGANTYSGPTYVFSGTLAAGAKNAFSASSAVQITSGATLDLAGFSQTISSLGDFNGNLGGTVTNSGTTAAVLTNQGASSSFSGSLKDGANGGTLGLTENAAGNTLTLSGNNNYTGATIVQAGTLQGGATNAFSLYSATTVNSGATIDLGGYNQAVGSLSGGGTVTNSGTTSARLINTGPSSTFSGVISDGSNGGTTGLQQGSSAGGTLTLSGANTYSGPTYVFSGTLAAGAKNAFSASSAVQITSGATLDLAGFSQTISSLGDFNGNLGGTVTNSGTTAAVLTNQGASSSFSGSLKDGANGGTLGLTENAAGNTLTLSGNNNYTGATTVQAGTLQGGAAGAFSANSATTVQQGGTLDLGGFNQTVSSLAGAGIVTNSGSSDAVLTNQGASSSFSGAITDGATNKTGLTENAAGNTLTLSGANTYTGATTVQAGTLKGGAANAFAANSGTTVQQGGTLDLGGYGQTISSLSDGGVAGGTVTNSGSSDAVLTNQGASSSFSGAITDGATNKTGLTQNAADNTLTLSGANTYTGATTVQAGTLKAGAANALAANSATTVNAGATLDIGGFDQTVSALAGGGRVTNSGGAIAGLTNRGTTSTFSGVLLDGASPLSLTQNAAGNALILTGNSTYSGGTAITAGTLQLGNGGTSGAINGNVLDNGTLAFNRSDNTNFAGAILGSGNVVQAGIGTMTLSGKSTYTGATTVQTGTLRAGAFGAFSATSATTVDAGATLDLSGFNQTVSSLSGAGKVQSVSNSAVLTNQGASSTFAGTIVNAGPFTTGLIQNSAGNTLTLSGLNTYTGSTTVQAGTLAAGVANAFSSSSITTVKSGGTLDLGGFSQTIINPNLYGGTIQNGTLTSALGITSYGGTVANIGGSTSIRLSYAASIPGATGTTTLSGSNSYTGATVIYTGATLAAANANALSAASLTAVDSNSTLDLGGFAQTVNQIFLEGGTIKNGALTSSGGISSFGGTVSNLAGSTGLTTKAGEGSPSITTITGSNSYTGATVLSFATQKFGANLVPIGSNLVAGNTNAFAANSATDIQTASTLDLGGFAQTVNNLTLDGGYLRNGNLTSSGGIQAKGGFVIGIGGSTGLTTTVGQTNLQGINTYAGATMVNGGTLYAWVDNALSADSATTVNTGGRLVLGNHAETVNSLTLAGGVIGGGTLTSSGGIQSSGGTVVSIAGSTGLATSAGTTTLNGTNSYTGATMVTAGTLIGGGANALSAASATTVNAGGTLDLGGFAQTVDSLSLGGGTIQNGTLTSSGGILSNGGTVANIAGSTGLATSAGTTTLAGSNAYTGATTINGGTLIGGAAGAFSAASATTVNAGGTLDLGGYNQTVSSLAGAGAVTNSGATPAALINQGGASIVSGTIQDGASPVALVQNSAGNNLVLAGNNTYTGGTMIAAGTLQIGNGGTSGAITGNVINNDTLIFNRSDSASFTGTISGSGSVVQAGTGTLTLSAANSYTGGTFVSAGTLAVQNAQALGTGTLKLGNNGALLIAGNGITLANPIIISATTDPTISVPAGNTDTLAGQISGTGPLTINGGGTLVLNAANSYAGPTTIAASNVVVNGSLAAATSVTLTGGATLSGTGRTGALAVARGSTLQPGLTTPGTQIAVNGNLTFASGASYVVFANPTTSTSTVVAGTATLTGAVVQANFAPGRYITNKYDILTASGGLGGTSFAGLNSLGLAAYIRTSLSYDANNVYLNLTAALDNGATTGLPTNQQAVVNTINSYFNGGGAVPNSYLGLFNLSGAALGQAMASLSGELATGAARTAQQTTGSFLGAMLDPFAAGRGQGCAARQASAPGDNADAGANACGYAPRLSIWATAAGGRDKLRGNYAKVGNHTMVDDDFGAASGLDVHLGQNATLGVAVSGGRAQWNVGQGLGQGHDDYFQIGSNAAANLGRFYVNGALAYGWHRVATTRNVFGADNIAASYHGHDFGGRIEAGVRIGAFSPYVAYQAQRFTMPGYAEADAGAGQFALAYAGSQLSDTRFEAGSRLDATLATGNDQSLALRLRLAYVHDAATNPILAAAFTGLPGAGFSVAGAAPVRSSALGSSSLEYHIGYGTFFAKVDGDVASKEKSYQGSFGFRYSF